MDKLVCNFYEYLFDESIDHYERMISWAIEQENEEKVNEELMYESIKEHWESDFCAFCQHFGMCNFCVLGINGESCGDGIWREMDTSETWLEWIDNAENLLDFLIELKKLILSK